LSSQAEIHEMASSKVVTERRKGADALGSSFAHLPDKMQGWQDLLWLTQDSNSDVRRSAAVSLGSAFALLPDKDQGWQDLHKLTQDSDSDVRRGAAVSLGSAFVHLPDKTNGWEDLHKLAQDPKSYVRGRAAYALCLSFAHLPDKNKGWDDLHQLIQDPFSSVRWIAAGALGLAFAHLPDKNKGWDDLHQLTQDLESSVRLNAANTLGSAFIYLPDKAQAWEDLHLLTQDKESKVRFSAADSIGSAFAHLPDKAQSWEDLHRLTQDNTGEVRMFAYHSMGRVSIYRASQASDNDSIRSELEAAVEFFEKTYQGPSYINPAQFCGPFYHSYLALIFKDASEEEVQRYLAEAKGAVGNSKNKKYLLGAVENLARALQETQKLKERSRENIQSDLKAYLWYCDRAAEHMAAAEDSVPGVVKLLRKCNPIIEERIEATIAGIQKAAREICQVTRGSGTKYEAPGAQINLEAKSLSSEDPLKTFKTCTSIASSLKEFCRHLPQDKRGRGCEIVDEIEAEQELSGKLFMIDRALIYLQPNIGLAVHESATMDKLDQMDKKLNTIIFDLSQIKIGSGNIFANLCVVKTKLDEIAEMEKKAILDHESVSKNPAHPNEDQIKLGNLVGTKFLELEEILKTKATKEDIQAILKKMENLKLSAGLNGWVELLT